ncbi:MAG: glycosyltransferase family 1 protein, partial [Patescibacteria group bacterium]
AIIKQLSWPFKFGWTQFRLGAELIANPPDILFLPAHLLPMHHPAKTTAVIHDVAFRQFPEVYSSRELHLQKLGVQRILKRAWKIIVPSQFTKDEIKKYYPKADAKKIYVVPHGYDKTIYKTGHNAPIKSKTPYLLYIGRLESKKNICRLIQVFDLVKKNANQSYLKLLLIGQPAFGYQNIKKEIDKSKYKDDIKKTGWLASREIADYLKNASAFVFPSLYEGFGLPLLEAMACGCPVVCSQLKVFNEVARDAPLYFDPFDNQDIAAKIEEVLINNTLRDKMIETGLKIAENFSWEKSADLTLKLFKNN